MKSILFFFFITLSSYILAQSKAICTYEVITNKIDSDDDSVNIEVDASTQRAKKLINEGLKIAETYKYTLKFNKNESIFDVESVMQNDANNIYIQEIAKALVGKGLFYQNREENLNIHQLEISGGDFLISDCFYYNWEITKETKNIKGYQSYKAVKNCDNCNNAEEVWFTPDIAVPFGPLGYSGLPGLVLEVKKKLLTLRISNIDAVKSNLVIDRPTKGKMVTSGEYKEITDGIRAKVRQ